MVGEVLALMRDVAGQGMTMVIVTHEMAFAREVADRVVVMDDGQVVGRARPPRSRSAKRAHAPVPRGDHH